MRSFTKDGRSWEIELEGNTFHVIDGGKETTRKFISPDHARTQHDKAITTKLRQGWVEVLEAPASHGEEAPLPLDDLGALAVRADHLQDGGDFRGEVISLQLEQHRLAGDPSEEAVAKRRRLAEHAVTIIRENQRAVFGTLARAADATTADGPSPLSRPVVVTFRLGVADRLRLRASTSLSLSEAWNELVRLPIVRTLRSVTCGSSAPPRTGGHRTYQPFLDVFAKDVPGDLRELFLGDMPDRELDGMQLGRIGFLKATAPKLERLTLRGDWVDLGELPRGLRELKLEGCVTSATLGAVELALPLGLETVSLVADRQASGDADLGMRVIRLADALPKLRSLTIKRIHVPLDSLAERPMLSRLTHLDLNHCQLQDEGGQHLLRFADRFEHVSLGLRMNGFSDELVAGIRTRLPRARVLGQWELRHHEDDRYDEIRE